MKKILLFAISALLVAVSCSKFEPGGTATEALAGNWYCVVFIPDGDGGWEPYKGLEVMTYNTAANVSSEIWLDDLGAFWGTKCKVAAEPSTGRFGEIGTEFLDVYYGVPQMIWGGRVIKGGAIAPGTGSVVDRIEFFIAFSDDYEPYADPYYITGYRRTGFPEDTEQFILDPSLPPVPEVPGVIKPLE